MKLLLEAALLEFDETGQVQDSQSMLFQMFTKIKYLQMKRQEVQKYIQMLTRLLEKMAKEQTNLRINTEAFKNEFRRCIILLQETYEALDFYNQNKHSTNMY